eukprot:5051480-Alexandrium_andersonii.AAC.1
MDCPSVDDSNKPLPPMTRLHPRAAVAAVVTTRRTEQLRRASATHEATGERETKCSRGTSLLRAGVPKKQSKGSERA